MTTGPTATITVATASGVHLHSRFRCTVSDIDDIEVPRCPMSYWLHTKTAVDLFPPDQCGSVRQCHRWLHIDRQTVCSSHNDDNESPPDPSNRRHPYTVLNTAAIRRLTYAQE